ncbi:uncharacterized protein C8Q71DRAFT_735623 [Rhodofomes roseus]|uniref:SAP domain-containing protein n=1 Tax=Rhodofomes roseus TaxID=34475 RepID=A0ABQ8KVF4_9APHY|nr:uncharacterized protein C8Q71DRAFT_735623 [Rhodofomes roseus]KAH9843030.1 hypothetical protein C8Q71DRAFT_735623 [Rhodofomes roseus]
MHRTALQRTLRTVPARRSFVSTVLLTKSWESETVNELKKEAKRRGLSLQGNKATLVTRLRQDDQHKSVTPGPAVSANVPKQVRHASTAEVPGIPSTSQPPPMPKEFPREFLRVALPDVSQPDPETPVQIPLLPDLWGASASAPKAQPSTDSGALAPKMVAVAGSATHHGGGPTHSLSSDEAYVEEDTTPAKSENKSIWRDIVDDLNLPTSFKPSKVADQAFDVAAKTETSGEKSHSRTLDSDEVRGLWVLLGLLAGSWVAAGAFQPTSVYAQKTEEVVENTAETATGGH